MKSCCKCGKKISSGYIICDECNNKSEITLDYYIDQLAELIVFDYNAPSCSLCEMHGCDDQQSGITCRHYVKEFLHTQKKTFADNLNTEFERNKAQYTLMNNFRASGETDIGVIESRLCEAFPQLTVRKMDVILATWQDCGCHIGTLT